MAQMGFFDLSDRYASLDAKKDPLVEIDAVVPWEEFRPTLERVWRKPDAARKSRAGRKPMDAVLMFKTLVLGALYSLAAGLGLSAFAAITGFGVMVAVMMWLIGRRHRYNCKHYADEVEHLLTIARSDVRHG